MKKICMCCGSKNFTLYFVKRGYKLHKCRKCNFIFTSPLPKNVEKLYTEDYFLGSEKQHGYTNYEAELEVKKRVFQNYLDHINSLCPEKGSLLDVGAATGQFIQLAKNDGWSVYGLEISKYANNIMGEKGLKSKQGTIQTVGFKKNSFDVITLLDTLEHLSEPIEDFGIISKWLKPDGLVVINSCDGSSLVAKVMRSRWHGFVPPEHIHYFNSECIKYFLKGYGLERILMKKLGKRFTLSYIIGVLYNLYQISLLRWLKKVMTKSKIGRIVIQLNLRDNFFIVARKHEKN